MSDAITVAERYLKAANSDDLRVVEHEQKDVDRILAAACASRGSPWGLLALRVNRVRTTGDMAGAGRLATEMGEQLNAYLKRQSMGRHSGSAKVERLPEVTARDLAMTLLKWMQHPTCRACRGRKHPIIPETNVLDTSRLCGSCQGTGLVPLERLVRQEHVEHIRWLAGRVDRACAEVFGDMRRLLRREVE